MGGRAVRSDAGDRDDTRRTVAEAGPLDILVVNAGVADFALAHEMDPDGVDRMLDINVRGPFHAAAEAAKTMPDGGRIVFIGSVNGDRMPMRGRRRLRDDEERGAGDHAWDGAGLGR